MLINDQLKNTENLSETNKSIARYLLEVQHNIKDENVRHIAKKTYTSSTSVLRFCQKLGFEGFIDFKEAYLDEIKYLESHFQNVDANFPFFANDKNISIANKLSILYNETIQDSLSLLDHNTLQQAANILNKAGNIYICGSGVTKNLANIFKSNMVKIGKTVISFESTGDAFYEASYRDDKSCFIIISYSGETSQVVRIAKKLEQRNLPTISITSYGNNTVSEYCTCNLYISTRQKLISNLGNYSINLSILFILDILYSDCFRFHYRENLVKKIHYSRELENNRSSDNPILKEFSDFIDIE